MASVTNEVGPEDLAGATAATILASTLSPPVVESSPQIWSICLTHADKFDRALVESWKGDMDGILIFSGLFSAIVTAFLIDSYKALQPDFATANANLTAQVAILLARSTNQTEPVLPPMPSQNSYTAYLIINALWFLSLSFSLTCALAATLVQQWSRTYLQGTEERFNPHQRVRMRTYLHQGVQTFRFSDLVEAIPMLLHMALFLFFIGLLVFLFNLNTTLAHILLVLVIPALFIYTLLTALPVFFYDCPYKTPLTSVLSYLTYLVAAYRPRLRRHRRQAALNQWHPEKQTTHLATLWAQDGSAQGAELDHTALRWTFLALADPKDLEEFIDALPGLLQSDSGTGFTHDGARAAQSLLFGPDMLAKNIVYLLNSTVPSCASALAPADRRRLDARAATCLSTVSLLARACEGPTQATPHLWSAWATTYANPVARYALTLRSQHPSAPMLSALAQGTVLLLAWRALVTYRTFLSDIHQRATMAANAPPVLQDRFASELRSRLSAGAYLALVLRDVLHGLAGEPASGVAPGAPLAQHCEELLGGALHAYMPGAAGLGVGVGAGAGAGPSRTANWDVRALMQAAQADMAKAKACLAVLFMHAACSLPADAAGQEMMRSLAAPLPWPEPCEFEGTDAAMRLLLSVRHAHGHETLTVFDADEIVALYLSIHDPRQPRAETSNASAAGGSSGYILPRRTTWRQATH